MAEVTLEVRRADGTPAPAKVRVDLWGAGEPVAGTVTATGERVVSPLVTYADGKRTESPQVGRVVLDDLVPNADITPDGTVWRIQLGDQDPEYYTVDGAGTLTATDPPGDITPPQLQLHIVDPIHVPTPVGQPAGRIPTTDGAGGWTLDDPDLTFATDADVAALQAELDTHEALEDGVHGISAFGASLVDDADAAEARATLNVTPVTIGALPTAGGTMTGPLLIPDGTEAQPSIAFGDDTGTGFWSAANGALSASVSGSRALRLIGGGSTFLGDNAGDSDSSGSCVGIGRDALLSNTTGTNNTAFGVGSLRSNTTGISNTAQGISSLRSNTTGSSNTAMGTSTLFANTTGTNNTAVGVSALTANTAGTNNTGTGTNTLLSNTTGANNTATGSSSLAACTIGGSNTATGAQSLLSLTVASNTTATGFGALRSLTTGANSTATGYHAGYAPGGVTANATTTAARQVFVGTESGQGSATQRDDVVAVGYRALVDGVGAIAIGSGCNAGAAGAVAIGRSAAGSAASTTTADEIRLGVAAHTVAVPGLIRWLTAGNEQTTVGAAGAAAALPATPTKYLKVRDSAGTTLVIPAYAAA